MNIKFIYSLIFCLTIFAISSNAQNSLAVTVFEDVDGNGLHDGGEPTIPGVLTTELRLWQDVNTNGAIDGPDIEFMHDGGIADIYTFGTGNILPDADYILEYVEAGGPGSYYVTKRVNGVGVVDMDNDIDPIFNVAGFNLSGGVSETLIDLGLVIAGNIGGYTWTDENGNGIEDEGVGFELDGLSVTLLNAMTLAPMVNDIDFLPLTNPILTGGTLPGMYSFDNLPPGQYIVQFSVPVPSPDPWYPTQVTVDTDATDPTNDSDAENNSAAANYLQSHTIILLSNETDEEDRIDAGFFQASSIGDLVWEDENGDGIQDLGEPGINGVTVSLLDDTGAPAIGADGLVIPDQITANVLGVDGIYEFALVAPGDYQVQFSLPAPIGGVSWYPTEFNPADTDATDPDIDSDANNDPTDVANYLKSHVINIASGDMDEDARIDAGFWLPATIGDKVFCDENGNGIDDDAAGGVDGVTVTLIDSNTGLTALDADGNNLMTTTAGGGMYVFELVPPGVYIVKFEFNGVITDPPYVFTLQNAAGSTEATDSDVNNDPTQSKYGETEEFTVTSQDIDEETKWDAGVFKLVDLSGTIWFDAGMDGINTGEAGPGGVPMVLTETNGVYPPVNILSSVDGKYDFTEVPPGLYTITITAAAFAPGASLTGTMSCAGMNSADDMVDNDDNGSDTSPGAVTSSTFQILSNCNPGAPPLIEYIDFCFEFDCGTENTIAAPACDQIIPINTICDVVTLDNFCNLMPTGNSGGTQPTPLCPGEGGAHNISWFAFVAYEGNYSVTVTPTNCTAGTMNNFGVQIGLYTDCTFTETVYCEPDCSEDPVTFESDGSGIGQISPLIPGQTYYFFIDGCSGSVCSYDVEIMGNPTIPIITPTDMCILDENDMPDCTLDDAVVCPGTDVSFQVQGLDLTVNYTWSINTLMGGPFTGSTTQMSTDENLMLPFDNPGEYEVCINTIENGCSASTWSGALCRTIVVQVIPDESFPDITICEEDLATFTFDIFDTEDPNSDGDFGWMVVGATPAFGNISGTVTRADGCMYEQEFDLLMFPEAPQGLVDQTLCAGDLPLMIDALTITELSFLGETTFTLDDYLLVNETDQNGCDSIIDINLEILTIFGGSLTQGLCLPEGIIIDFAYNTDMDLSTDISFFTFEWTDPAGNPLDDNFWNPLDPIDNLAPVGIGSGTYGLTITVDKDGVSCTFDYDVVIDFESEFPPQPDISGPGLNVCEADSIVTYAAIDFGNAFGFTWTWPADVTSAMTNAMGDSLTINWSGSVGGSITLITENGCGMSPEAEIMITVVPQPTPSFDFTTEVCVDSCTIIEFVGDDSDIASFMWGFDGGTESNGTGSVGPGPHCVSWPDAGDKTITLSYTDNAGCVSAITMETVTVVAPIVAPIINCNPNTGEVSFNWDDVGTSYAVEVTSISSVTGMLHEGVLTGTTFTVDNLADGETVTIILTIFTADACQMITTTSPGCTSQNCIAPNITLTSDITSFCLDANSGTATISAIINSGENGSGVFSGSGIVDPINGIFDPDSANIGINTITYLFMTDDLPTPCIGNQSIQIEVLETPIASFTTDVDTICITDQFNLTYDGTSGVSAFTWDYGVDGNGTGGPNPVVTYTSPGEKTIRLTVEKDGCQSESAMITVFVQPELEDILVTCSIQEIDQVQFSWNAIAGATGYLVDIMNGASFETIDTFYGETGLNPDDMVTITVTVLTDSKCPGSSFTETCTAVSCPSFTIDFLNPIADYCEDGTMATVTLMAMATGGDGSGIYTWSGPNVTSDGIFDPNELAEGDHEILVIYEENSCQGGSSFTFNVTATPTAAFSVDNTTNCVGDTVNITYEGSQLPNQMISWIPLGLVMEGDVVGDDEYIAIFNTDGTFDIQLDVINGVCTTTSAIESITVEPELVFGDIICDEEKEQITFTWNAVDCASQYEVFVTIDAGAEMSQGFQTTTEHIVTGLQVGQEVTIRVEAESGCACPGVMNTLICETEECNPVNLSISPMGDVYEYCFSPDLPAIEILPNPDGTEGNGTFEWTSSAVGAIDQDGIFDPVIAGVGTHTIFFDFLESEGCPYRDSIMITIHDLPSVTQQFDSLLCFDQLNTSLELIPSGGDGNYELTLNGDMADLLNDVTAGSYDIVVTDGNQCTDSTSVTIPIPNEPMPSIMGATDLILGDSSTYLIQSSLFDGTTVDSVIWMANGSVVCNDPACFSLGNQTPLENTTYEVTVYYNSGCVVTAEALTVTVTVIEPPSIVEIANIISPNNDGVNDSWQIVTNDNDVIINSIRVFDRWGNMVWGFSGPLNAKDNNIIWDGKYNGKFLQPGVYVYFVDLVQEGRNKIRSGDLTIIN